MQSKLSRHVSNLLKVTAIAVSTIGGASAAEAAMIFESNVFPLVEEIACPPPVVGVQGMSLTGVTGMDTIIVDSIGLEATFTTPVTTYFNPPTTQSVGLSAINLQFLANDLSAANGLYLVTAIHEFNLEAMATGVTLTQYTSASLVLPL
jgi:hypothetical protein